MVRAASPVVTSNPRTSAGSSASHERIDAALAKAATDNSRIARRCASEVPVTCGFEGSRHQASVKLSVPSFSMLLVMRSPAFSHTRFSGGMPWMTPCGVPVKMTSPGSSAKWRDT
jgi:hypothetical protein